MYKTVWLINWEDGTKTELSFYHFGKTPKFPTWYFEPEHVYSVEMLWNVRLIPCIASFYKCLSHAYIIK